MSVQRNLTETMDYSPCVFGQNLKNQVLTPAIKDAITAHLKGYLVVQDVAP